MTRQVLITSPTLTRKKPCLSPEDPKTARKGNKLGEVVGRTTAECVAVCCCCPCSVMELLVLGLYKVPTALCKKAWKMTKPHCMTKKNPGLLGQANDQPTLKELEAELDRMVGKGIQGGEDQDDGCKGAADLDKEMWDRFYGTGFWRSPSQRDT
ncbi:uncharacterized protein LOC111302053 [Durio zibethinus]|uniref:Uncharacterized protein LOC111302053 n=1 Tax=Durio zibethinus TaxID=66656 RepID=A0A6P5ZLF3_DURZI|nr:uncharacterized protein LOC111302053 [Durio zibethinus]